MNRMKRRQYTRFVHVVVFCVLIFGINVAWPEDTPLKFPKTEKEIVEALGGELPDALKVPSGLPSNNDRSLFGDQQGNVTARGVDSVEDDQVLAGLTEEMLEKAPKVGALVLFDFNSTKIKPESQALLREYGKALQGALANTVLVVAGHTDSKGTEIYNLGLSRRRAEAVKNFLVSNFQIDERRLLIKPYGEHKPIESNETEQGRAQNRRVEFIRIR